MAERRDVIRTRALIENAYYELLFKKNDNKITVNDVINEANISRGTFYAHYKDITDLASQVENSIVNSIKDTISKTTLDEVINNPREQVKIVSRIILGHKEELKMLLTNVETSHIITKLKTLFIQALTQKRMFQKSQAEVEIIDSCISGLLFDPCIYWIMSDSPIPQEQLIDMISDFLSGGMSKLFTP